VFFVKKYINFFLGRYLTMGNRADYPLVTREEEIFEVLSKELKIQKNRGNELSFKGKTYRGISRFLGEFDE
jgi:hypothetical protein